MYFVLKSKSFISRLGATWGVAGVVILLAYAVGRLAAITVESFDTVWDWRVWAVMGINGAFMLYSEGYRGFQQAFSPRVVARARHIFEHPTIASVLLAPLFCMGYFNATRRRLITSYLLTVFIILCIVAFQYLDQPWRGALDAGVVLGLSWGVISILAFAWVAVKQPQSFSFATDVPSLDEVATTNSRREQ
ncbi:MAG: hypothetical protein K0U93_12815 [Gammaproteobacteria bacterium]|nr:hypothetical protein [Gammaproteobacteria bacterium]